MKRFHSDFPSTGSAVSCLLAMAVSFFGVFASTTARASILNNESGNAAPPALQADIVVGCVEPVYSRPVNLKNSTSPRENLAPECPAEELFRRISVNASGHEVLEHFQGQLVSPASEHGTSYVGVHTFE